MKDCGKELAVQHRREQTGVWCTDLNAGVWCGTGPLVCSAVVHVCHKQFCSWKTIKYMKQITNLKGSMPRTLYLVCKFTHILCKCGTFGCWKCNLLLLQLSKHWVFSAVFLKTSIVCCNNHYCLFLGGVCPIYVIQSPGVKRPSYFSLRY